ncbi:MAG: TIGR03915 family putative DNA repair protein, partial [Betaproteobacteria bacterium]
MQHVSVSDFSSWRSAARSLLNRNIAPERVTWIDPRSAVLHLALSMAPEPDIQPTSGSRSISIPRDALQLLEACACHRDGQRWGLMYRLVWRLNHGERRLLEIAADDDVRELSMMLKAVNRDCHKMKAFVRFREVADAAGESRYVAWFEPEHHILQRAAPFFVDRFASMHWTIVTPEGAAQWDLTRLWFLDDVAAIALPASDEKETLWRAYYGSIFNPARLKQRTMQREMPKRYWKNLPEAHDIAELADRAQRRVEGMLTTAPVDLDRWHS